MPRIDDATRAKLLSDHPDVRFIPITAAPTDAVDGEPTPAVSEDVLYEFAFRKGARADWKRHQELLREGAMGRSPGSVGVEATLYAQGRLVHPPANARGEWDELKESAPDILQDIGHELLKEHTKGLRVSLGKP